MAPHHIIWKRRPIVNTYVRIIGNRLKWNSTITTLVVRTSYETYGTIVDLLDVISSRHVSRVLFSTHGRISQDSHARVIILLVLL